MNRILIENHSQALIKCHSGEVLCINADFMDTYDGLLSAWLGKDLVFVAKMDNVEYAFIRK